MTSQRPFFSVIVPTYLRPAELPGCLDALARQQFPTDSFEVIVVDDGGSSPPGGTVQEFQNRLAVSLVTAGHGGPAAARNQGVQRARGRFFAFTDDDCRPAAEWLSTLAKRFATLPDHLIGGRTINALAQNPYAATSQVILDVVYRRFNGAEPGEAQFLASNNLALAADSFRAIGGFDSSFPTSEDRELCDRWLRNGHRITYAPEAVVFHAHPLNLRRFWGQHFGYGCGAWRFHRLRERHGHGRFRPDLSFYRQLAMAPFAQERRLRTPAIAALVVISQVANAAGFFYQSRRRKPDPDQPDPIKER
jgi:glycosyltransferase involved in cell wall biosynthesis